MAKNQDTRYVWSPENGGCIMQQMFDGTIWRDWNSLDEGMHPLFTDRVKALVKWYNLELKNQKAREKAQDLYNLYLKALAKSEKITAKQNAVWSRYKGT